MAELNFDAEIKTYNSNDGTTYEIQDTQLVYYTRKLLSESYRLFPIWNGQ